MTPPQDASPLQLPALSDSVSSVRIPKLRSESPSASLASLPFRRASPSLNSLFASTASLSSESGTATPSASTVPGSVFSPASHSEDSAFPFGTTSAGSDEARQLIARSFAPHVGVLASGDTEELIHAKGLPGGLLELLRPFGERITGKLAIRDSVGASKVVDDFGVRFTGLQDGLGYASQPRKSQDTGHGGSDREKDARGAPGSQVAPWSRMGGEVGHIEETVDRHITYSEARQPFGSMTDYMNQNNVPTPDGTMSPFFSLYLRRLLSGLPMAPHETFAHPVACVIAISSHSASPIEELRRLYTSTTAGDHRLPQWVNNEYLRYYVLVHDEDHDDIKQSSALFEQMKRHFGLHCHLLRIRSTQAVPSDDESLRLPLCEWMSAAEELSEIQRREVADDDADPTPCVFESDATAIRSFVRELVASSIVPLMERMCATWNEQILQRRKGLSGRFMSLSKKWTPFGSSSRSSSGTSQGSSNYDSLQGFYRPDAPEALMRKLADYAFMLRDYKLALSTYDLLRADFNNDKAWKYYAGANEMTTLAALLNTGAVSSKSRIENIDQYLEAASYSYVTRSAAPYYALRTLALGFELLKIRGSSAADDAARWATRILELRLVGPFGHALLLDRISACYNSRRGVGSLEWGSRKRKAAFWATLATERWLHLGKTTLAERSLNNAGLLYGIIKPSDSAATAKPTKEEQDPSVGDEKPPLQVGPPPLDFGMIRSFIDQLRESLESQQYRAQGFDGNNDSLQLENEEPEVEEVVSESLDLPTRLHRRSLMGGGVVPFSSLDSGPMSPARARADDDSGFRLDEKFE